MTSTADGITTTAADPVLSRGLDRPRLRGAGTEPVHDPRPVAPNGSEPGAARRRERRPGGAGLDRQQDDPRALDGRLQSLLVRPRAGLAADAGYPNDAQRFRSAIETAAAAQRCDPAIWWRVK